MRIAIIATLLLAGCEAVAPKAKPEPESLLCQGHQTLGEAVAMPTGTPAQELNQRASIMAACIWNNAVDLAPARDSANLVAKAVIHECSLELLTVNTSSLKVNYPNVTSEVEKDAIIRREREDWAEEALSSVIKARAGYAFAEGRLAAS